MARKNWKNYLLPNRRRLKIYAAVLLVLVLIKVIWYNLFVMDAEAVLSDKERSLMERRALLVNVLKDPAALLKSMPSGLPPQFQGEWAIVSYSMTGMALANLAQTHPETREESAKVVTSLVDQVLAEPIRKFDKARWREDPLETLEDGYGHIGYLGHLNLLLAAEAYLNDTPKHLDLFHKVSAALTKRLEDSEFGLDYTYPSELYVPDNCAVVGSLGLYYQLFPEKDKNFVEKWLQKMERLRDRETGLLAFSVSISGEPLERGRGSGSAWNIFYLSYADSEWAQAQFGKVKEHLYQPLFLGMAGIREYPKGVEGSGDVDSGPVILGASPAGTGFAIAGARLTGDKEFLQQMLRTSEFIGWTWSWNSQKEFLLAPLVGDAIMLAMLTTTPWSPQKNHINEI